MDGRSGAVEVRVVDLATTLDLRRRVLRSHLPGAPATAPTDELAGTWHLGAFRDQTLVGVITGFDQEAPGLPGRAAERFRFMAVEPSQQGTGVGRTLIAEVAARARERAIHVLWAHGRDSALDFYRSLGFAVVGPAFDDPVSLLPHRVVMLEL